MKILHINNFASPDYLNDMVFHGGRTLFGKDYEESSKASYMYKDYAYPERLYGRGFTLYAQLEPNEHIDDNNVSAKILSRYYDYVIYGSCFRNSDLLHVVKKVYPKNKIVFIDGEDHNGIYWDLAKQGHYFKRECLYNNTEIHPINFSIPKNKIDFSKDKTKQFSTCDPDKPETYIFHNEKDYYDDMKISYFAKTKKKAGYDCLRHYEIIANGCFPAFENVYKIPEYTMCGFPKKIVYNYFQKNKYIYTPTYWEVLEEIQNYFLKYCTTDILVKNILGVIA